MIKALIFDFDGLIIDTEVPDYQSWQEIYQERDCQLPLALWTGYIGKAAELFDAYAHLEQLSGQPVDRATVRIRRRKRYIELVAAQPILPGVEAYITTAKRLGLKLAVASSGTREWVVGHLTQRGLLAYFDQITCADDVQRAKPDPDLYLTTLAALGIQAEEAIALEDSPNGVLAANRAGIFCVAIPNPLTCQLPLDHADLRLASLQDLPLEDLLSRLTNHQTPS
ncbi:MAG TPA: HAD family hydrolase [Ktedonobacteraceae bacterium]|nr:HAD family hydrolase [Ktedonobacteraceae bacterium]